MRHLILVLLLVLVGCSNAPTHTDIPVFTAPTIIMPVRPILRSDGNGEIGILTKNIELDLVDLKTYAIELENFLNELTSTNKQINK